MNPRFRKSLSNKIFKTDMVTLRQETDVTFYRSSGLGGEKKHNTETAVRLSHRPSGLKVIATEHRSQPKNRQLAFQQLQKKLLELNRTSKKRVPTKTPPVVQEKRIPSKQSLSKNKVLRANVRNK
ncbi:MAG TPA: peptide chain release factor-like protein [Nitrospiria bacterium]|jgi:protein subunit release factor B